MTERPQLTFYDRDGRRLALTEGGWAKLDSYLGTDRAGTIAALHPDIPYNDILNAEDWTESDEHAG